MTVLCKRKLKSDLRLNMVIHCEIFVAVIFIFGTQGSGFNITYCKNSDSVNINITFKDIDQPRQLDFKKENYSEILVSCDLDQAKCTNDRLASVHKGVAHIQMPLSYGRRFEISEDGQPKAINTEDAVSCHGKECNWRFLDDKTPPSHAVSPSPCHMALGLFLLALLINQRCFCFSFILLVCFLWAFLF
ncbi:uncharacterized protein LOC125654589 isoform X2 [Ostrea edulis]|uniref:uncharacterized protein LOC125654589 isoform X2 n=1 Tax=Ostrea edulis TaxID=37623 RepID=UPI0020958EB2|nr:uncharacterized protein LOC125654589 isoform X2 [Ostrea edulis]XP_048740531.1 uncharacterized protein LOC125654589 isoform X2 [Ostrea edulis]